MPKVICFDLEGPLSPQDNAYEVMGLLPEGHRIFEVISRYDDILTLEGRENYEPGDTLSLIIPFLIYHDVSEEDIRKVSQRARIVPGAKELMGKLKELGWEVYIISTSYEQHAFQIGEKIGVDRKKIFSTNFPLDEFKKELEVEDFSLVKEVEGVMLEQLSTAPDEEKLKQVLDKFFWEDLKNMPLGKIMSLVKVRGGQRKVEAVYEIAEKTGEELEEMIVVGDSITDFKMLQKVKDAGGIAVVFNGNEYAIPYANIALATLDMKDLLVIIEAYSQGGKEKVQEVIENKEKENSGDGPYFHWLQKEKEEEVLKIHKKFRALMRGEAARLG